MALLITLLTTATLATLAGQANANKLSAVTFHDDMRKLWEDHITWTRAVIVTFAAGPLPEFGATVTRLLQNQVDIGNAIKPFYGDAAGNQLTALLHDHIILAAQILQAAKAGNNTALNTSLTAWYANANDIAAFLHNANPTNWSLATLQTMMKAHLDHTLAEAVFQLQGNFTVSIATYEQVHLQILGMADMLSLGIIHQFPNMFTDLGALQASGHNE